MTGEADIKQISKREFNLPDFLCWQMLFIIFPAVNNQLNASQIVLAFIYGCAVYYAGEWLLYKSRVVNSLPYLVKAGLYFICGAIACGIVYLFVPSGIIIYSLAFVFVADLFFSKRISLIFSAREFLYLLPFFVILFQTYELTYGTAERYSRADGDYMYYTAMVESLKTNHSLWNAVYHAGSPIYYTALPFLAPAQLANFAGIPSQFALWGMFGKLIPVLALGTLAQAVIQIFKYLFPGNIDNIEGYKARLLVSLSLLFLGPLHLLNLVKLDLQNVLFLGEGFVLPVGSPGFAMGIFFTGLLFLIVFSVISYSAKDRIMIVACLAAIAMSKLALLVPIGLFLGILSVCWLIARRRDLFYTLVFALPICLVSYRLIIGGSASVYSPLEFSGEGYFITYFKQLGEKYGLPGGETFKVAGMLLITLVMWLSIKIIIFTTALSQTWKNKKLKMLLASAITGFILSLLPAFFIHTYIKDARGHIVFDDSFNMTQFIRGSIFILSVLAVVLLLYLVIAQSGRLTSRIFLIISSAWMLMIAISYFSTEFTRPHTVNQDWYSEVKSSFIHYKPALMVMHGDSVYSVQTLTGAGVHPFFSTGLRENGDGVIATTNASDRSNMVNRIFSTEYSLTAMSSMIKGLKVLGVDCIVATPHSMNTINFARDHALITLVPGTKWFYKIL